MNKKILIVDESDLMKQEIANMFSDCIIETANDGASAIASYVAFKPDLVTLSLGLMIFDGYEVLCKLLEIDKNAKVIIIASAENYITIKKCFERGAYGYLPKPFTHNELYAIIKNTNSYNKRVLFVFVKHMNNLCASFKPMASSSISVSLVSLDVKHPMIIQSMLTVNTPTIINADTVSQRKYNAPGTRLITEILQKNSPIGAIVSRFDSNDLTIVCDKNNMAKSSNCNFELINILHHKLLTVIDNVLHTEMCLGKMQYFEQDLVKKYNSINMTKVRYEIKYDEIVLPMTVYLYFNNSMLFNSMK